MLALIAGTVGATWPMPMPLATRRRFAFVLAGPAFGLTWALGFWLAALIGHRLLSIWVIGSLMLSLLSLQGVLYAAGREGRASRRVLIWSVVMLVGTAWLMTFRPG